MEYISSTRRRIQFTVQRLRYGPEFSVIGTLEVDEYAYNICINIGIYIKYMRYTQHTAGKWFGALTFILLRLYICRRFCHAENQSHRIHACTSPLLQPGIIFNSVCKFDSIKWADVVVIHFFLLWLVYRCGCFYLNGKL